MSTATCPHCSLVVPADAPEGLCPSCLLAGARAARRPSRVAGYEIVEELGRGGMGVVYLARQSAPSRLVALKMILAGEFASEAELSRFRTEIELAGKLDHPNIVKIYDGSGAHDGHPFYTMQLVKGGTLADPERQKTFRDPRRAAELITLIARAVQHGHARGVLHRDLKPANILLDDEGRPYIGDFGVARVLDREGAAPSGVIVGTPEYMAPEQVSGDSAGVTTASDVYGLGAILYELLTGRPPFSGTSVVALLQSIAHEEPEPPRRLVPGLDRDLDAVCLTALEKDPARRYGSAAELADDLERALRGEPTLARPARPFGRLWRWARRHPLLAFGVVGVSALLVLVTVLALSIARAQEQELRREALRMNAYAARAQAGGVLYGLREYSDRVERLAEQASVKTLLSRIEPTTDAHALRQSAEHGFDSVTAFGRDGVPRARWPMADAAYFARNNGFAWRDYFRGAAELARRGKSGSYVARAFRSEADRRFKFAISAPVYDERGVWLGVVMGSVGTDSALGKLQLGDPEDRRRTAMLLGPRDNERADAAAGRPLPGHWSVLVHDGLAHGIEHPMPAEMVDRMKDVLSIASKPGEQFQVSARATFTDDHHLDPIPGFEGRWLAGAAPVGGTGYLVLVQTRYDAVIEPNRTLARRLAVQVGAPLGIGLGMLAIAAFVMARRRRS